jgi:hypothetical protein
MLLPPSPPSPHQLLCRKTSEAAAAETTDDEEEGGGAKVGESTWAVVMSDSSAKSALKSTELTEEKENPLVRSTPSRSATPRLVS